jgi:hypothetical protein
MSDLRSPKPHRKGAMASSSETPKPEPAAEPPHPWGPHMRIGKVFLKGNDRTKCVSIWRLHSFC